MKKLKVKKTTSFIIALFVSLSSFSQIDSLDLAYKTQKKNAFFKSAILPTGLCLTGIILNDAATKMQLQNFIQESTNGYRTSIDVYIQYAPIAEMYIADIIGIQAKNDAWGQTKNLAMAELGTAIIVQTLKRVINLPRPDGAAYSYPSGHSSRAAVTSQVLYNEFKETNTFIAYSGFVFSSSTAALRVVNNRHWVPDVLLGTGIAMLVTNAVYYYEPLKNWQPFKKKNLNNLGFYPIMGENYYGANMSFRF